ncbi:MAG: DUF6272 family protein [Brumimicrobium sp.]
MHGSKQYLSVFTNRYTQIYGNICFIKHDTITHILADLKTSLDTSYNLKKKIYSIVNELLENTLLHQKDEEGKVEIAILKSPDCYRIITFNTSSIDGISDLLEHSTSINSLSKPELKQQYKEKLLTGEINKKGTIGVGMELIRLKSNNKILISTEESDEERIVIIDVKIDDV